MAKGFQKIAKNIDEMLNAHLESFFSRGTGWSAPAKTIFLEQKPTVGAMMENNYRIIWRGIF